MNSLRKRSPELSFGNLHPECGVTQSDFECEPVEQLEMEVDDIVIHDSDDEELKSNDDDLCPIANDPFKPVEPKPFDKGTAHVLITFAHIECIMGHYHLCICTNFRKRYRFV